MAKTNTKKTENIKVDEIKEEKIKTKKTNTAEKELLKQLEEIKQLQKQLLQEKQEFEKEKEDFEKNKKSQAHVASNEFIDVICNIPKFEYSDIPAYDIGTRTSGRFKGMPVYGSTVSMQFSELQEILGYQNSGLILCSVLIDKKHQNAIKELGLQKIYEHVVYPEDMNDFLSKPIEEIEEVIIGCPERMKDALVEVCKNKISKGEIDFSVAKLRRLEEILNAKL